MARKSPRHDRKSAAEGAGLKLVKEFCPIFCFRTWLALLSGASQLVGNVGFSIILTVFLKVRHKVNGSRIVI